MGDVRSREASEDLLEVVDALADSSGSLAELVDAAAPAIARALDASAMVWTVAEDGGHLVPASWAARDDPSEAELVEQASRTLCAPGEGLAGRVWVTGRALSVRADDDPRTVSEALRRYPTIAGVTGRALFFAPLVRREEVLGVLAVIRDAARPEEASRGFELLEQVSHRLARAMEMARLLDRTRAAERRQRLVAEAGTAIAAGPNDLPSLLDTVAGALAGALDADLRVAVVDGAGKPVTATAAAPADGTSGTRATVASDAAPTDAVVTAVLDSGETTLSTAAHDLVGVPMQAHGARLGAVVAGRPAPRGFDADDVAVLRMLADRAALAVHNGLLVERLTASENRHRALAAHANDVILLLDDVGRLLYASPAADRMLGGLPIGTDTTLLVHREDRGEVREVLRRALATPGMTGPVTFRLRHGAGTYRVAEAVASNLLHDESVAGLVVTVRDVTDLTVRVEQQHETARLGELALSGASLPALCDQAVEGVCRGTGAVGVSLVEHTTSGLSLRASRGWSADVLERLAATPASPTLPVWRVLATGEPVVVDDLQADPEAAPAGVLEQGWRSSAAVLLGHQDDPWGVLTAYSDHPRAFSRDAVSFLAGMGSIVATAVSRMRTENAIRYQAMHDTLTRLPNRTLLRDRLDQALTAAQREGRHVVLLLLDLDGFKDVNDALGHHAGDDLLVAVGQRLRSALRDVDTVARLGGDEFAVVLTGLDTTSVVDSVAGKVLAALRVPVEIGGMVVPLDASIGVALAPQHGSTSAELLRHADVAMYRAKRSGLDVAVFDAQVDTAQAQRLTALHELRHGIEAGQLELHFQPIVSLRTGAPVKTEALVRWRHPRRGLVPPIEFISLAEQSGLIRDLTDCVLDTAVAESLRLERAGLALPIAVNLSGVVLTGATDLVPAFTARLGAAGVGPDRIALEVTESVLVDEPARAALHRLRAAGVTLSIDDFGTGYSSLAWLKGLPVTYLKIDRAFVTNLETDSRDVAIVRSIVELAHALGVSVVAEGVETPGGAQVLAALGVDLAQGYWFSRPLPATDLHDWLAARRGRMTSLDA
ncbi:MAG: EAL domain-containing protein [Actinomycetota bacterium]|nr:EAL domain-containing protein [Actinomycetota bacterium]